MFISHLNCTIKQFHSSYFQSLLLDVKQRSERSDDKEDEKNNGFHLCMKFLAHFMLTACNLSSTQAHD